MKRPIDLSIIIPNYNSGNLLENSLKSIFSDPCPFSFEVLILDNLSKDDPAAILGNFPNELIRFYSKRDEGVYDAMNEGIKLAKGNWLFFLGAGDEVIMPNWQEIELNSNLSMIYGNVLLVEKGELYDGEFDLLKLMHQNINHQAIFYNHQIFEEIGFYNLKYKIVSDYFFNLKVFLRFRKQVLFYPVVISKFLGGGLSDSTRDDLFHDHKLKILANMILNNISFYNIFCFFKYIQSDLVLRVRYILKKAKA